MPFDDVIMAFFLHTNTFSEAQFPQNLQKQGIKTYVPGREKAWRHPMNLGLLWFWQFRPALEARPSRNEYYSQEAAPQGEYRLLGW